MIPPFRVYLFDVDGTLLDSEADICGAVRAAMEEAGVTGLEQSYLRRFIGFHLFELFSEVLPHYSQEQKQALLMRYRTIYHERGHASTRIYAGVEQMLGRLGGLKSTATTKSSETTRYVLGKFGLARFFDHVQGTDGFPSKPEPDVILKSLEHFGVQPEECLLVGDSAPDMAAGRRAGVKTCGVTYGYGNLDDMRAHAPDYWISSPLELMA